MSGKETGDEHDDRTTLAPGAPETLYPDSLDGPTTDEQPVPADRHPTGDTSVNLDDNDVPTAPWTER